MIIEKFKKIYGEGNGGEIRLFHSPGRVNIIGEHTDYNGGYVFPCALNFGTFAALRRREDSKICFASTNMELTATLDLDGIKYDGAMDWVNYPLGIVDYFLRQGCEISGFEVLFEGNIPNGAGLSSSASIELAMAVALNNVFNLGYEMLELVKIAQKCENKFCGVNCGIMDQFAVGMGKKDYAILLNCSTLEYEYVPFKLNGYRLLICNTNKRRGLNDSKYNERRAECETAAEILGVPNLSALTVEEFNANAGKIKNDAVASRARHVITENKRCLDAVAALKNNDLKTLGELMIQSHNSLRGDYEVTGIELDTLVTEALKLDYVLGARMTGAGFGGCAIALVKEDKVSEFIEVVTKNYAEKIGYPPTMYVAETGDGTMEIF